jgi:SRSO17 transposase
VLAAVRAHALPAIEEHGPIRAWIVDDTGLPKKGRLSVGVARQYCGQVGKRDNCQVAVTLSLANEHASLPIAYRLYLPEGWADDPARRAMAGVPEEVTFATKPAIALDQIRQAVADGVPRGVVVTDAGYGNDTGFREGVAALGLPYVAGIQGTTTLWAPGTGPLPAKPRTGRGRPPKRLRRDASHQPLAATKPAMALPGDAWRQVTWREGTAGTLASRFAAVRVRPAHRDTDRAGPRAEEWLLVEWPEGEEEPTKYWLSTLSGTAAIGELVATAKLRWRIERDFEELKQELGLGHFEGRGWRGFHHHASLCIAAYAFLVAERCRFSPGRRPRPRAPERARTYRPRGSPGPARTAQSRLDRHLAPPSRACAHGEPAAMSLLPANLPAAAWTNSFVTR